MQLASPSRRSVHVHTCGPRAHLWLSLAEMSDVNKVCFFDAPISQAGLFGTLIRSKNPAIQRRGFHLGSEQGRTHSA